MAQVALCLDTGVLRSIHHQLHTVETGLSAAFRKTVSEQVMGDSCHQFMAGSMTKHYRKTWDWMGFICYGKIPLDMGKDLMEVNGENL